jgi:hypothetical protein
MGRSGFLAGTASTVLLLSGFLPLSSSADETASEVQLPPLQVPYSQLASPEARADVAAAERRMQSLRGSDLQARRKWFDEVRTPPLIAKAQARYPVTIQAGRIAGVYVETFTPGSGSAPATH